MVFVGCNGPEKGGIGANGGHRLLRYDDRGIRGYEEFYWEAQGPLKQVEQGIVLESFVPASGVAVESRVRL